MLIKEKRRGLQQAGQLLVQDNALVHTAQVAVEEAAKSGFQLLPQAPYLPDLALSNFFYLFPKLKCYLRATIFRVIHAVEEYLEAQDVILGKGIVKLEH